MKTRPITLITSTRAPFARLDQRHAAPRRAGRIVERTDQPRRALDEHQRLALVPRMIAAGDDVGAGVDHLVVDRLGDAEAAGRVLAVDDDAIELPVALEARQALGHGRAARTAPPHRRRTEDAFSFRADRSRRAPLARDRGARRAA